MSGEVPRTLLTGLAFPESPRWRGDRLWFSEKRAHRVMTVDVHGTTAIAAVVVGEPSGLGWTPDGDLLVVSMTDQRLLRMTGGTLHEVADLGRLARGKCNDMVVDSKGRAYVGHFGYDLLAGESPAPASLIMVAPDGEFREVADGLAFPNGCVITQDARTLVVAESGANRLTAFDIAEDGGLSGRRVFADLAQTVPDGICMDAEGAIWVADPLGHEAVRIRPGGQILERISTGEQGAFACELGGSDGRTLFICTYAEAETMGPQGAATGCITMIDVEVPSAAAA
jgi:sugar lactone lactonase YvrE